MTKPRQLKTFLFKIICNRWEKTLKEPEERFVEIRQEHAFDTWYLEDLNKVITHLIKCREWVEEETK